ncbi:ATP-binding protein [Leptonema illini]|uniref:ORC1/DEAH AAA+ ATPase domain-containing protein n=1 Tax=Leptonema illini DSM 21528 TaxID=929563 RepID=H2CKH5_9LEPT|nr:ATP-binding protein [Leptonema illini]EHQ08280.1 hypothetical protein Lepil_3623 [Leptonema illini DSM 21528]
MTTKLVETRNVRAVKAACTRALQTNGMLAVMAEVGSGKTTLYNHMVDYWQQYPHKFSVVKVKAFKGQGPSRISALSKLLVRAIDPELHIPGDIESRYEVLARALRYNATHNNRRVILAIDEAQDLSLQTFRDLKKLHEIDGRDRRGEHQDNLFSILYFGKLHNTWDRLFSLPELGYRINRVKLELLTSEEIILFAEQKWNLKFQDIKTKERFPAVVRHKTPLGVKYVSMALRQTEEFVDWPDHQPITVRKDHLQILPLLSLKWMVKQSGYTLQQLTDLAKEKGVKSASRQRISEMLSGKLQDSAIGQQLENAVASIVGAGQEKEIEAVG